MLGSTKVSIALYVVFRRFFSVLCRADSQSFCHLRLISVAIILHASKRVIVHSPRSVLSYHIDFTLLLATESRTVGTDRTTAAIQTDTKSIGTTKPHKSHKHEATRTLYCRYQATSSTVSK